MVNWRSYELSERWELSEGVLVWVGGEGEVGSWELSEGVLVWVDGQRNTVHQVKGRPWEGGMWGLSDGVMDGEREHMVQVHCQLPLEVDL